MHGWPWHLVVISLAEKPCDQFIAGPCSSIMRACGSSYPGSTQGLRTQGFRACGLRAAGLCFQGLRAQRLRAKGVHLSLPESP